MKPKVLVVATSKKARGGIATVVSAISKQDVWKEHKCCWINTHIDKGYALKLWYLLSGLLKYIILLPFYHIVHIHVSTRVSANRKYIFFKLARLFGKKTVIHLHCGSQLSKIWNNKYEDMFTNCNICLTLSNSIKEYILSRVSPKGKIEVLYNPCPNVTKNNTIKSDNNTILFAATLYKAKGYLDLIEAFGKVAKKYPEWRLLLAGNGDKQEGIEMAKKYGVEERVEFLGWIKDKRKEEIFRTSTIFCLPSYAEGFPMAVLDAWAYGLPVITTPVGGIPDIVTDGKNGLLFTPGDTTMLSEKLELLIGDTTLRQRLSYEARKLADTTFNIKTISKYLSGIYATL
ncbi:MAG: glycosyltransferase family 4 protein [Bacteroidaceae bacterium]|nr:glycosyltransferase family 4 protein [Bacteroidaceae bacterium]